MFLNKPLSFLSQALIAGSGSDLFKLKKINSKN